MTKEKLTAKQSSEILVEVHAIGNILRVAALETNTLEEIRFNVPRTLTGHEITTLAQQRMIAHIERLKAAS